MIFYSDVNRQDFFVEEKIYDLESIYQSLDSILNTEKGERLFLPEFGVELEKFLFNLMDWKNRILLFEEVYGAITKWEPRVEIDFQKSGVVEDPLDHTVYLVLVFSIKGKKEDMYVYQTSLTDLQKGRYYEF